MTQSDIIQTILKDSNYHLDLFHASEIQSLRQRIEGNQKTPITYCSIRGKAVQLKPEELIRQLYVERVLNQYHYPRERVRFEHLVNFGREKKRADIVILDKDRADTPYQIFRYKTSPFKAGMS
ncbi:type I restriction enzyme HsdR N-terminal domain-containing protein [Candidatus Poribacteria bacterium]|nr:type I restriction enzyme HsdR N-terminal domain-containing protein [Candidatus Poribacteria bacterium]MYG07443.1 type I restriction enzyme HsdR N-terminal domain-containing protein [Candidatus Poribacteria bacterium]MYK20915.1 type I restriction enzyme HsdR N-terminal domain-containing protein [Candidatus Poribacteria bacterium]